MNEPIGLTPAEICHLILAICGAIITISGAITIIVHLITKAKEPNKQQNHRLDGLENEVEIIRKRLERGDKRFEEDNDKILKIEQSMKTTNRIIIESLQALTAHAIDGNNTKKLEDSKKRLEEYLLNKV